MYTYIPIYLYLYLYIYIYIYIYVCVCVCVCVYVYRVNPIYLLTPMPFQVVEVLENPQKEHRLLELLKNKT